VSRLAEGTEVCVDRCGLLDDALATEGISRSLSILMTARVDRVEDRGGGRKEEELCGGFREGVPQARDTGSSRLPNSHEDCIRMALYEDKDLRNNAENHLQPLDPRSSA